MYWSQSCNWNLKMKFTLILFIWLRRANLCFSDQANCLFELKQVFYIKSKFWVHLNWQLYKIQTFATQFKLMLLFTSPFMQNFPQQLDKLLFIRKWATITFDTEREGSDISSPEGNYIELCEEIGYGVQIYYCIIYHQYLYTCSVANFIKLTIFMSC